MVGSVRARDRPSDGHGETRSRSEARSETGGGVDIRGDWRGDVMAKRTSTATAEATGEESSAPTPQRTQKMDRVRYEFVLEAALPIAHHEGTFGNEAVIMRRKIRQKDGWAKVPIVTGDTMRHGMREAAAYVLLDARERRCHLTRRLSRALRARPDDGAYGWMRAEPRHSGPAHGRRCDADLR